VAFSTEYIYRIIDKFSGPLSKITQNTDKFQRVIKSTSFSVTRMGNKLDTIGSKLSNIGGAIGGAATAAALYSVTKEASNMEDAMGDVARVTTMSGKTLTGFENKLDAIAIKTGKSALGLAAIATEGGKIGIADKQMLAFVTTVSKAAMAFDTTDEEAGRSIGSISAKLGLSVAAVDTLLQRVNYLADNTSANGKDMINIIERTSGTFKLLKIPPAVAVGWAGFANQMEVSSELAASGLNMMMSRMMKIPGMMPKMLKDPTGAVKDFLGKLAKMPEATRGTAILKLFGEEAGRFVMKAVTSMDKLDEAMKKAASNKALGSMDREFENIMRRSSTFGRRLLQIFAAIRKSIGKDFLETFDRAFPVIEKLGMGILKFVRLHPGLVKIAGAIGAILVAVVSIAVPVGLLFGALAAGAPILAAIAAGVGAISLPFVVGAAAVMSLITMFYQLWQNSTTLRGAFTNLADAFSPLTNGFKTITNLIFGLSDTMVVSNTTLQTWGDMFAVVINMTAAIIKTLFDLLDSGFKILIPLILGDFNGAWEASKEVLKSWGDYFSKIFDWVMKKIELLIGMFDKLKNMDVGNIVSGAGNKMLDWGKDALSFVGIGHGAAQKKAAPVATNVNMTGGFTVKAEPGTTVTGASANLNNGSNIAMVQ
jgi:TP901 family phage tail tape measure protein